MSDMSRENMWEIAQGWLQSYSPKLTVVKIFDAEAETIGDKEDSVVSVNDMQAGDIAGFVVDMCDYKMADGALTKVQMYAQIVSIYPNGLLICASDKTLGKSMWICLIGKEMVTKNAVLYSYCKVFGTFMQAREYIVRDREKGVAEKE